MKKLKDVLICLVLVSVLSFFGAATFVVVSAWSLRGVVGKAIATRIDPVKTSTTKLTDSLTATSDAAKKVVQDLPKDVLAKVDKHLTKIEGTVNATVDKAKDSIDKANTTVNRLADKTDPLVTAYADAGKKIPSLLEAYTLLGQSTNKLVVDAKDSWDQNYDDVVNELNSLEVATTGIAKAAQEVGKAAPKLVESVGSTAKSFAGIAENGKKLTDEFMRPKTWKEQVKDYFRVGVVAASKF